MDVLCYGFAEFAGARNLEPAAHGQGIGKAGGLS